MPVPRVSPSATASAFARRRNLWWQFTVRAVEVRHRGSVLGLAWSVLNPLLMLALYVTVFSIFGASFAIPGHDSVQDFALGVFVGLILFHVVAETIGAAPGYIVSNPNLVKKVVFPLEVLPLANLSAIWFHFFISLLLLLVAAPLMGRPPSLAGLAWLPVILVPHMLFSAGLAWLLAALGVFFRDLTQIAAFVSQALLYASAVFFAPVFIAQKSELAWDILKWNPILQTVDLIRRTLLWHQPLSAAPLIYVWAAGIAMFAVGLWFFRKTQRAFADVI